MKLQFYTRLIKRDDEIFISLQDVTNMLGSAIQTDSVEEMYEALLKEIKGGKS